MTSEQLGPAIGAPLLFNGLIFTLILNKHERQARQHGFPLNIA